MATIGTIKLDRDGSMTGEMNTLRLSARDQSDYLAVTLDDPSFASPIYAAMFERRDEPDTFDLVWERPSRE